MERENTSIEQIKRALKHLAEQPKGVMKERLADLQESLGNELKILGIESEAEFHRLIAELLKQLRVKQEAEKRREEANALIRAAEIARRVQGKEEREMKLLERARKALEQAAKVYAIMPDERGLVEIARVCERLAEEIETDPREKLRHLEKAIILLQAECVRLEIVGDYQSLTLTALHDLGYLYKKSAEIAEQPNEKIELMVEGAEQIGRVAKLLEEKAEYERAARIRAEEADLYKKAKKIAEENQQSQRKKYLLLRKELLALSSAAKLFRISGKYEDAEQMLINKAHRCGEEAERSSDPKKRIALLVELAVAYRQRVLVLIKAGDRRKIAYLYQKIAYSYKEAAKVAEKVGENEKRDQLLQMALRAYKQEIR